MQLRNEIIEKFRSFHLKGYQIVQHFRYKDFKDNIPIAFVIQVGFHPQVNFVENLPKESIFDCFKGTLLENQYIFIKGETVE